MSEKESEAISEMIRAKEIELIKLKELKYYVDKQTSESKKSTGLIDIKYIGVPNICFSLTEFDDAREARYSKQRMKYGFDDSETWYLSSTIANFILPRLKRFWESPCTYPGYMTYEEWLDTIEKMIYSFQIIVDDDIDLHEKFKEYEEGMELFCKHFLSLWK